MIYFLPSNLHAIEYWLIIWSNLAKIIFVMIFANSQIRFWNSDDVWIIAWRFMNWFFFHNAIFFIDFSSKKVFYFIIVAKIFLFISWVQYHPHVISVNEIYLKNDLWRSLVEPKTIDKNMRACLCCLLIGVDASILKSNTAMYRIHICVRLMSFKMRRSKAHTP